MARKKICHMTCKIGSDNEWQLFWCISPSGVLAEDSPHRHRRFSTPRHATPRHATLRASRVSLKMILSSLPNFFTHSSLTPVPPGPHWCIAAVLSCPAPLDSRRPCRRTGRGPGRQKIVKRGWTPLFLRRSRAGQGRAGHRLHDQGGSIDVRPVNRLVRTGLGAC